MRLKYLRILNLNKYSNISAPIYNPYIIRRLFSKVFLRSKILANFKSNAKAFLYIVFIDINSNSTSTRDTESTFQSDAYPYVNSNCHSGGNTYGNVNFTTTNTREWHSTRRTKNTKVVARVERKTQKPFYEQIVFCNTLLTIKTHFLCYNVIVNKVPLKLFGARTSLLTAFNIR